MRTVIANLLLDYIWYCPVARGKYRLASIASHVLDGVAVKTDSGPRLHSRFKDSTFWLNARGGQQHTLELFSDLTDVDTFLDIGANEGIVSLWAAVRMPVGRVIAFEPSVDLYCNLIKNIRLNKASNVVPLNIALGDRSSLVPFQFGSGAHSGGGRLQPRSETEQRADITQVLSKSLDSLVDDLKLADSKKVFCKIDVEGSELLVVKGMENLLNTGNIRQVVVEIDSRNMALFGATPIELYDFLTDRGFECQKGLQDGHYDECFRKA